MVQLMFTMLGKCQKCQENVSVNHIRNGQGIVSVGVKTIKPDSNIENKEYQYFEKVKTTII